MSNPNLPTTIRLCSNCSSDNTETRLASLQLFVACNMCKHEEFLEDNTAQGVTIFTSSVSSPSLEPSKEDTDDAESFSGSSLPTPAPKRQRTLIASCSLNEIGYSQHSRDQPDRRPYESLNSIDTELNSEMIDRHRRSLSNNLRQQQCKSCSGTNLAAVVDLEGVFYCTACDDIVGIDDSMNIYEIKDFIDQGDYSMAPCPCCQNNDPKLFTLEVGSGGGNETENLCVIKCSVCSTVQGMDTVNSTAMIDSAARIGSVLPNGYWYNSYEDGNEVVDTEMNSKDISTYEQAYAVESDTHCRDISASVAAPPPQGNGQNFGRTRIAHLCQLARGDHIAQHQALGYWHHSIVVSVEPEQGWINVIHYNGPDGVIHKGVIMYEWLFIDPRNIALYRYDYEVEKCNTPDEVLRLAHTRIGEHSYNILRNNCEHFARWCKTGVRCSQQVNHFESAVKRKFIGVNPNLAKHVINAWRNPADAIPVARKMLNIAFNPTAAGDNLGVAAKAMGTGEVKQQVAMFSPKVMGAVSMVVLEVVSVCRDIRRAKDQRAQGHISREEFLKIVVKRSCEGVGSAAGTAIALPLPAAWIGMPLSALVGHGIGAFVGRQLAEKFIK